MPKLVNLARMTTATAGTGTITLGSAVAGYLTFAQAGVADGDVVSYAIKDDSNSEIGTGTYTSAGTTLTRTVTKSTNSNAAISLSGAAEVFITPRAEDLLSTRGHIFGLTLSNNGSDATNDIDIAAGEATSTEANSPVLMVLASALTKRLDASWAVGTGNGGLDTGSIANATYHVWLIQRSDTGVVDALFSTSASSPTMPTNYDRKRRIGSIVRTGGAIKAFVQDGDLFMWSTPVGDVSALDPGTSAVTRTLTLPTGVRIRAKVSYAMQASNTGMPGSLYLSDLSAADTAASISVMTGYQYTVIGSGLLVVGGVAEVMTNTSAQIRSRIQFSDASTTIFINTLGWVDTRGRDA